MSRLVHAAALPADILAVEGVERKWLLLGCGILMPLLMKDAWTVAAAPELAHLCLLQPSRPLEPTRFWEK